MSRARIRGVVCGWILAAAVGCAGGPKPVTAPKKPPAAREESQGPKPAPTAIWQDGHWAWSAERKEFHWVSGSWAAERPGKVWLPGYWSAVEGGWRWTPPRWVDAQQEGER